MALGTLNKTIKTIESISKLVEQVQALARQARQSSDDAANGVRDTLGAQIATTLNPDHRTDPRRRLQRQEPARRGS